MSSNYLVICSAAHAVILDFMHVKSTSTKPLYCVGAKFPVILTKLDGFRINIEWNRTAQFLRDLLSQTFSIFNLFRYRYSREKLKLGYLLCNTMDFTFLGRSHLYSTSTRCVTFMYQCSTLWSTVHYKSRHQVPRRWLKCERLQGNEK